MTIADRIAERLGFARVNNATPLPAITRNSSAWTELFGANGPLPPLTEGTALQIAAVYACVSLIAGAIAAMPMHVYRRAPDGERDRLPNDDLWWLLNEQFSPRWSAANGWEYLVQSLLMHGDGFAKIKRQGARIVGIEPVHPSRVTVAPWPDGQRLAYAIEPDPSILAEHRTAGREVLDQDDVLHFAGFGFDGLRGLSPLRYALRMAGSVAQATQDYSAQFFANGARPDYALQSDQPVKAEDVDKIREQLAENHGTSNGRAHKPMVLTGGLKFQAITMPLEDAQLIATRQFQIEEIARIYGIPPFMIGHNEKTTSWGSGVEAMGIGFVRYALRQHLNKFHNEINRKFFRTATRFAEFDTTELERADTKSLFDAFRVALGRAGEPGFMTVDEVRERINLKRKPGGDTLNTGGTNAPEQTAQPAGV